MSTKHKAALAATILLMPGGFILGAVLLTKHINTRRKTSVSKNKDNGQ